MVSVVVDPNSLATATLPAGDATSTPLRRGASVAVLLIEVLLEDRFGRSTELVKFFYFA